MTEFSIPTWLFHALAISVGASAFLNGAPFLPGLRSLKPSRIEARWVGYIGLSAALGVWVFFHREAPAVHVGIAWILICLGTLIPNTFVHFYRRDNGQEEEDVPSFLTRRQQALLENAIAEYLEARRAMEVLEIMLKSLHDPRYAGDPDKNSIH